VCYYPAIGCIQGAIVNRTRWSNNFDTEMDWNLVTTPMAGVNNRQVKLSRGRFLSGCSGCNGTLCIRGCKQDYDDWGLEGWTGEEFFKYMRKVMIPRSLLGPFLTFTVRNLSFEALVQGRQGKPRLLRPASYRTTRSRAHLAAAA
jgi:Choline dehydrogenase and related flavoproteins